MVAVFTFIDDDVEDDAAFVVGTAAAMAVAAAVAVVIVAVAANVCGFSIAMTSSAFRLP